MASDLSKLWNGYREILYYIFLTLIISSVYLSAHIYPGFHFQQARYAELSNEEKVDIQHIIQKVEQDSLLKSTFSEAGKDQLIRDKVFSYLESQYLVFSPSALKQQLVNFSNADYDSGFLNNLTFKTESFFWQADDGLFWEVIFWALLGVLCSHLYHISDWKRIGQYKKSERFVHLAKLVYTPIIVLVIYFNLDLLIAENQVSLMGMSHGVLVLSFLLGFFSGRSIELLNRVKDAVFPGGKESSESSVEDQDEKKFEALSEKQQLELMKQAIDEKGEAWISEFKNYDGGVCIAKKTKTSGGKEKEMDQNCLVFQVSKKESMDSNWKIPEYIDFRGYKIPTDVVEAGETVSCSAVLAQPGSGIYRKKENFGTLGIRVKTNQREESDNFILSCYHVLFPDEMEKNVDTVLSEEGCIGSPDVYAIKKEKEKEEEEEGIAESTLIAKAHQGKLSKELDVGLARILDDSAIGKDILKIGRVKGVYNLLKADEEFEKDVKIYGHTSADRKGVIKSIYCGQTVNYHKKKRLWLRGLIQISSPAEKGDSGAPVTTLDGKLVGMVIGTDDKYTYAISMKKIFGYYNLSEDAI